MLGGNRRLYVGNLSYDVSWQDLKDHFKQIGNVTRADIMTEPGGRSKGCGLVEFATAIEAQEAMSRLNETELRGRLIFVREDREAGATVGVSAPPPHRVVAPHINYGYPAHGGGSGGGRSVHMGEPVFGCRLYVGNLSYESTWQSLKDHFKNSGNVTRADVQQDNDGRSKGYGFVEFTNPHEAASAYAQLNNSYLDGRQIFVREDREEGK